MPYNAKQVRQASTSERNNEHDNEHDNEYDDTKEIRPAYISEHNNESDTHVNLLMITDETLALPWHWHWIIGITLQ